MSLRRRTATGNEILSGGAHKLYDSTGQNEDGSMTQKAVTDALKDASDDITNSIATIEETMVASKAYAAGEYIYVRAADSMYKVTTSIASGAALTVGTNIVKTIVGDELTILNSAISSIQNSYYRDHIFIRTLPNIGTNISGKILEISLVNDSLLLWIGGSDSAHRFMYHFNSVSYNKIFDTNELTITKKTGAVYHVTPRSWLRGVFIGYDQFSVKLINA